MKYKSQPKKLFIISNSTEVKHIFDLALCNFHKIETTWIDSLVPAEKLLKQCSYTPFGVRPDVIVIDPTVSDFDDPHLQKRFCLLSKELPILLILPGAMQKEEISAWGLKFLDVLPSPLIPDEVVFRLMSAFAFAENQSSKEFFQSAITDLGAGILILDAFEKIVWLNPMAEALLGYNQEDLSGRPFSLLTERIDVLPNNLDLPAPREIKVQMTRQDSSRFLAGCFFSSFNSPAVTGFTVVFHDASENKKREDELLLSAKVFECSGEAIMITDDKDRILTVNGAFTTMTGYTNAEVIGRHPSFLNSGRHDSLFHEKMWAVVHKDGHWTGEVWNRLKSGRIKPMWVAMTAIGDTEKEYDHYITIFSNITDRLAEEKHLRHLAQHDFLTGLPNRVLLKDRFSQAAANASRNDTKIAVLFMDLDKFKQINDRHGHIIGDRLLEQIAERLLCRLRSTDTASRWGGDEFVMLFPGMVEMENVAGIVEKIGDTLQQPFTVNDEIYHISASIGVSFFPDHGSDLDELLDHADAAMYSAKKEEGSFTAFAKKES